MVITVNISKQKKITADPAFLSLAKLYDHKSGTGLLILHAACSQKERHTERILGIEVSDELQLIYNLVIVII